MTATILPENATDKTVAWTNSNNAIAIVANGKVIAISVGTATITAKAGNQTANCVITVANPLTFDEGVIINGIKWATRNVDVPGTFAAKPEDSGMFYQWNRIKAWPATGTVTGWDSSIPAGDTWDRANDPSPAGWRVPTLAEIQKLTDTNYVTYEWINNNNGLIGGKFTDKATGNSIFLPAAGCRYSDDGTLGIVGSRGYYWSSAVRYDYVNDAYTLVFDSGYAYWYGSGGRSGGQSVRAVAE